MEALMFRSDRPILKYGLIAMSLALLAIAVALATTIAQAQTAGGVHGRVLDAQGRPVAGAEMRAYYSSYGGGQLQHGGTYNRGAITDRDGRYSISLRGLPPGLYYVSGAKDGVDLLPETPGTFGSNTTATRNFTQNLVETSSDDDYGNGAIFVAENALTDSTDLSGLEVTLRSRSGGQTITRTVRRTGEGQTITGIPFGAWEISARLNGRAVRIKAHEDWNGAFQSSVVMSGRPGVGERVMRAMIQP